MRIKFLTLFAVLGLSALISGCVSTVDGRMKTGIPFTKDKIVSRYERSISQIMSAARTVVQKNGVIETDDNAKNVIHGKVDTRHIWVKVSQVDPKLSEVIVQARTRAGSGDVDLASEISKQIAMQLTLASN